MVRSVLVLLALGLVGGLCGAQQQPWPGKYFGTSVSQLRLGADETQVFSYDASSCGEGLQYGVVTHWWIAGAPDTLIRFYVDGETDASIQFYPPEACATGFGDVSGPWATSMFGKGVGAEYFNWWSNVKMPFSSSVRVTLTGPEGAMIWFIVRGACSIPVTVGGFNLPLPGTRLVLQKTAQTMQPLDFLTVASAPVGTWGLLLQHTLIFEAGTLNSLEGCYHMYTEDAQEFPGILVSSGTEDFFDAAYYFEGYPEAPLRTFENSGLTHGFYNDTCAQVSAYRWFTNDLFPINNGFKLVWRNGDVQDDVTGLKCTSINGTVEGTPTAANVTTLSWMYFFPGSPRA